MTVFADSSALVKLYVPDTAPVFAAVNLTESILQDAARQSARHGLRAYDAVQLASALAARSADPSVDTVAVFDNALRRAALAEGFSILS